MSFAVEVRLEEEQWLLRAAVQEERGWPEEWDGNTPGKSRFGLAAWRMYYKRVVARRHGESEVEEAWNRQL